MLIVYENKPGGVSVYNQNLIRYLLKENFKFNVFEYSYSDSYKTTIKKNGKFFNALFSIYSSRYEILNSVKEIFSNQELIICSDFFELTVIYFFKLQCKVVFILHGDLPHYRSILNAKSRIIDCVFCVSNSLMKYYSRLYENLIFYCTPPLTDDFDLAIQINYYEPLKIVYAGRFVSLKGADILNKVSKLLLEKLNVEITYYLPVEANEGILIKEIPERVQVIYGLSNRTILEEFKKFDLLLFPSRSEGFGIVVVECMKRGIVPFVLNTALGPKDMVIHSETGFSFLEDEFVKEAFELIELLNFDRSRLAVIKNTASKFANNFFSFNECGKAFITSVNQAIKIKKNKSFTKMRFTKLEVIIPSFIYKFLKYAFKH